MATLESVFRTFGNGPEMEGRAFVKLCKDVKIIDAKFKATDADLIFAKVKSKGARKINFTQFKTALDEIAKRKKVDVTDLTVLVEGSSGPEFHGTQTEAVKFYDDKSLFTGVHQHGGPSTVDKGRTQISDLSRQLFHILSDFFMFGTSCVDGSINDLLLIR